MGRHAGNRASGRHQPRRRPADPRYCDRGDNCTALVVVAILAPTPPGARRRWGAFEAADVTPWSVHASRCRVIVAGRQAWRPADLVEDYMVRHAISETAARELVSGFPWHRSHHHEPAHPVEPTHPHEHEEHTR